MSSRPRDRRTCRRSHEGHEVDPIGDNAVDPEIEESFHFLNLVNRPDMHELAEAMGYLNQLIRYHRNPVPGDRNLERYRRRTEGVNPGPHPASGDRLYGFGGTGRRRNLLSADFSEAKEPIRGERTHDQAIGELAVLDHPSERLDDTVVLDVDHESEVGERLKHRGEGGNADPLTSKGIRIANTVVVARIEEL